MMRPKIKKSCLIAIISVTASLILSACASMSDSIILGVGSGAAAGASIGHNVRGEAGAGALVGAAIGGLSAYFIHKGIEKREERVRRETLLNLDKFDVSRPPGSRAISIPVGGGHYLTKPVVDMEWTETQVQGDKLVEGHRVWKIIEKPKWIPTNDYDSSPKE